MTSRYERALKQRLLLVDSNVRNTSTYNVNYGILGSTGKRYNIDVANTVRCSCPDFTYRKQICKHIIFLWTKVWKRHFDGLTYPIRTTLEERHQYHLVAAGSDATLHTEQKPVEDDCCCICLEDICQDDVLIWCKHCGKNIHTICYNRYVAHSPSTRCPLCREHGFLDSH